MLRACSCLSLLLCVAACERGERASVSPPCPDAPPSESGVGVPIFAVPQRPISALTSSWGFELDGRLVAEQFEIETTGQMACGIWDIASGSLVQQHVYSDAEDAGAYGPCIDWLHQGSVPTEISEDAKLHADVAGGLTIETYGVGTRAVPGCTSCDGAVDWAPSGHQLATANGAMLEIWDGDTGERLRSEKLGLSDVAQTWMGWSHEGIGVLALHEITASCKALAPRGDYCEYVESEQGSDEVSGFALSSFWLPADGGPLVADGEQWRGLDLPEVFTDVGVRWFALSQTFQFDRDGSETRVDVFGVGGRTSALGWSVIEDGNPEVDVTEAHGGFWRADASTQWLEGVTISRGLWDWNSRVQVGWRAVVAEPQAAAFHGWLGEFEHDGVVGEVELFAASDGVAAATWSICTEDDELEDPCKQGGPAIGECELLDVSPTLALTLADCEAGLQLLDGRGTIVFSLPHDPAAELRWGRSNYLALLEPDGKLGAIDLATGKTLYARTDVVELLEAPLAPEQDRLALRYADHLELVAGASGERIIDVAGEWIAAALSPDGKQLATLGGQQVRVIEIASGATIASAAVEDHHGVAWRQDGAALFYGYDWPTHAIDPKTGELLYELEHPVLDVLDVDDVDPSWRWIHRADGSIVRTIDFERIELGPTWARVDSGAFEGEAGDLPEHLRFRVGDDPHAPAIYTVAQLEPWLRASGLVAAFFAGKPLPRPTIPADALAKLGKR